MINTKIQEIPGDIVQIEDHRKGMKRQFIKNINNEMNLEKCFTKLPNEIWTANLKDISIRIYGYMVSKSNLNYEIIRNVMSKDLKITTRTIERSIQELKTFGYLEITKTGQKGKKPIYTYKILNPFENKEIQINKYPTEMSGTKEVSTRQKCREHKNDISKGVKQVIVNDTEIKETIKYPSEMSGYNKEEINKEEINPLPLKQEPEKIDEVKIINPEIEEVKNKLKEIGVNGITSLISKYSLSVIKKQIEFYNYQDYKSPGSLVNAIKDNTPAPPAFIQEQRRKERELFTRKWAPALLAWKVPACNSIQDMKFNLSIAILDSIDIINSKNNSPDHRFKIQHFKDQIITSCQKTFNNNGSSVKLKEVIEIIKESFSDKDNFRKSNYKYYSEKFESNQLSFNQIEKFLSTHLNLALEV